MRHVWITAVGALALAGPAFGQTKPGGDLQSQLVDLEKQSWAAWQNMDSVFWSRFLSDDHIELNGYIGMMGKADVIRGIASKACKVASYKVDHFSFRQIDPKTAVLIYRAEQDTTCGSVHVPSPVWATSLYQKRGGRWQNVLYEHSPVLIAPAKPKPN